MEVSASRSFACCEAAQEAGSAPVVESVWLGSAEIAIANLQMANAPGRAPAPPRHREETRTFHTGTQTLVITYLIKRSATKNLF